jgi:hypothetical protein
VLGAGPGKTSRRVETKSPVDDILAAKAARHVNVNLLQYFSDPSGSDANGKMLLGQAIRDAAATTLAGTVRPQVTEIIPSDVTAINAAIADMKAGRRSLGKTAIIVDEEYLR